ncbi:MAG: hypothetical protein LBR74_01755 [Eubacterium sp.]|jgi:hypothetical protein|nr:hypothetical protein [Eubacterium sp.]
MKKVKESDENIISEPKVLKQLVGSLESALDEETGEIEDLLDLNEISVESIPHRKRKAYIMVGIIAVVFSLIGIISTVVLSYQTINSIINKTKLKDEFAKFIYPVVITDPPEFASNQNLPSATVISAAIWRIIISGQTDLYPKDVGMITIPAVDVEYSVRSLFGSGFEIIHQSIDDIEIAFDYDVETNSYTIPAQIRYMTYTPQIGSISNIGELYTLHVYYIAPSPLSIAGIEYQNTPVKSMVYTVSRSKNKMTVNSIRYAEDQLKLYQE